MTNLILDDLSYKKIMKLILNGEIKSLLISVPTSIERLKLAVSYFHILLEMIKDSDLKFEFGVFQRAITDILESFDPNEDAFDKFRFFLIQFMEEAYGE